MSEDEMIQKNELPIRKVEAEAAKHAAEEPKPAQNLWAATTPLTFPMRLMQLLQTGDETKGIYWLNDGTQFAIHTEEVLPTLVSHFQGKHAHCRTRLRRAFHVHVSDNCAWTMLIKVQSGYHLHAL
jgi:hypothetical protein